MGSFDSFQISLTMDVVYFVDGKAVNAYSEGNQITTGIVSGNFQTYTKTETEISSENLEENQKITSKEGYYNGNYFLTTKGDYYNQKIYCGCLILSPDMFRCISSRDQRQRLADESTLNSLPLPTTTTHLLPDHPSHHATVFRQG